MKTIIKITKQEAIDAWKAQNNYQNDHKNIIFPHKPTNNDLKSRLSTDIDSIKYYKKFINNFSL